MTVQFTLPESWNTVPPPLRRRTRSTGEERPVEGRTWWEVWLEVALRSARLTSSQGFWLRPMIILGRLVYRKRMAESGGEV